MTSPLFSIKNLEENMGSRILIAQEQISHAKRLHQIYNKNPKHYSSTPFLIVPATTISKKERYENYEHHKNIEHLYNFISRKKKMSDRLKDSHDFYAFPAYFFRETKTKNKKAEGSKIKSKKSKVITQSEKQLKTGEEIQRKYGIDVSTVKKHLPILQYFTEQQLEQYTDSITRMIFNYNLNSKERVNFLKKCVLKTLQTRYPPEFPEVVEEIFEELMESLKFSSN